MFDEEPIFNYLFDLLERELIEEGAVEATRSAAQRILTYAKMPPLVALTELGERAKKYEEEKPDETA